MSAEPDTPAIAAEEYRRRLANARAAVRAGTVPRAQAEAAMRCWLVIACRAHADLTELRPMLAELTATPPDRRWILVAEDLAHRWNADWRTELARARDTAIAKSTPDACQRARNLVALADTLDVSRAHLHRASPPSPEPGEGPRVREQAEEPA